MTRRSKRKPAPRVNWQAGLTSPLLHQVLALLTIALGVITLLALFRVTSGRWADAWINLLRYWFGWGAYPAAVAILLTGLLWLQHHLDRPVKWRWRPFVGAELTFFSLLALTHTVVGRGDPWGLVEDGWGGGLVGWAVSVMLSTYMGWPATILLLLALLTLGLGLAFDVTSADVKRVVDAPSLPPGVSDRAQNPLRRKPSRLPGHARLRNAIAPRLPRPRPSLR